MRVLDTWTFLLGMQHEEKEAQNINAANEAKAIAAQGRVSNQHIPQTPLEKAQFILTDLSNNGTTEISRDNLRQELRRHQIPANAIEKIIEDLIDQGYIGNEVDGVFQIV